MKFMKIFSAIMLLATVTTFTFADPPYLIDRKTGKYLGNLSTNKYDLDSTSNPYGRYGSKYSPDSINNPYGRYGSRYSNDSPNNPYATNPPSIRHGGSRGIDGDVDYGYSPRY